MSEIHRLKSFTHPSLTGKSKITHEVGYHSDGRIVLRIIGNTGGGHYSSEWVPWNQILQCLKKASKEGPITSIHLHSLFKSKSVNSQSFLLAALLHQRVVIPLKDKKRNHELADVKPFLDGVQSLMKEKPTQRKKKTTKKKRGCS